MKLRKVFMEDKNLFYANLRGYDISRQGYVEQYFKEVGIRPFNPRLLSIAIKVSEIPLKTRSANPDAYHHADEQSLYSACMVYRHEGTLSVIGPDGHTYYMPDHPLICKELADCGYIVCAHGSTYPEGYDYPSPAFSFYGREDLYEKHSRNVEKVRELRDKYTPSEELYNKLRLMEINTYPDKDRRGKVYDIFGDSIGENPSLTAYQYLRDMIAYYGLDSDVTRRFLVVAGGIPHDDDEESIQFDSLDEYIDFILNGMYLNDEKYYAEDGFKSSFERDLKGEQR